MHLVGPKVVLVPDVRRRWDLLRQQPRSDQDFTRLRVHLAGAPGTDSGLVDAATWMAGYVDSAPTRWPSTNLLLSSSVAWNRGGRSGPLKFKDEALDRAADLAHRLDVDGALSGVSVIARRPDGAGIGCGSVGVGLMDTATEVDVSRDLHPDDLDNEGLAEEVAAFLCGAIDAIHQVAWGAAWFGGGEHEPYVTRLVGRFDERLLHGYSWVVVLTPFVCERLGGRNVVRHSLSELGVLEWTCGDYVVAALAAAPSSVTADSLRRWKEFLSPALAPLSDRLHRVLARRRGTEPIDTLPPFLFAADWYYRDPVPTGEAS